MNKNIIILIISITLLSSIGFSVISAQEKSKTEKRQDTVRGYLNNIKKYEGKSFSKLNQVLPIAKNQFEKTIEKGDSCIKDPIKESRSLCKEEFLKMYKNSQRIYRLTKFYAILAGVPTTCVKADIGYQPHLKAKGRTPLPSGNINPKETGQTAENRLFICGGNDNSVGNVKIKYRVQASNGRYVPITEEYKQKLNLTTDINNLPNKAQVTQAEEEYGIK